MTANRERTRSAWTRGGAIALTILWAAVGIESDARAGGDDAMRWLSSGDCRRAGDEINDGIGRNEAKAYMLAGYLYAATGCVEPDPARAARYYQRAIELGDVEARALLGLMCGLGWGVPQDYRAAYRWFSYGRSGNPLEASQEIAYGYASTVTQLALGKVQYPRFTSEQGTVYVTVDAFRRTVSFSSRGTGDQPRRRLERSTPFITAIATAYEDAFKAAPTPENLPDQGVAFEIPWTFQLH